MYGAGGKMGLLKPSLDPEPPPNDSGQPIVTSVWKPGDIGPHS